MTGFDLAGKRVFVAGHRGMVGGALVRRLQQENCTILTAGRDELNLCDQTAVRQWMAAQQPHVVLIAAAKVGGIHANSHYPVDFLYDNMMIEANLIEASYRVGVEKLLFLGSSCIYPREAEQPMREEALLTGPLEPTNEWYAIAKIAGIRLCQAYRQQYGCDYISAMPTNLYGPGDNFHPQNSHVPAALLRRFHEAKLADAPSVAVWGSGKPYREFLYVEDMADACVFMLKHYSGHSHLNVGSSREVTIAEFAQAIKDVVGYAGRLEFDTSRPDGAPRKLMDNSKLKEMGWEAPTSLPEGLAAYYRWFLDNIASVREA